MAKIQLSKIDVRVVEGGGLGGEMSVFGRVGGFEKGSERKVRLIPIWISKKGDKVLGTGPALSPNVCRIWQTFDGHVGWLSSKCIGDNSAMAIVAREP